MMGLEYQENMSYYEPSTGCVLGEVIPNYPQFGVTFEDGSSYPKDDKISYVVDGTTYFVPTYHRTAYPQDFYVWPSHHSDHQNALQTHFYHQIANQFYHMNHEYYTHGDTFMHAPFGKFNPQEFHYFVVIDFEATCDKDKNPNPQEIIEFPSVLVNSRTGGLEGQFQVYVRPTHNQQLSDFCTELTGIKQSQVDKGVILSEALLLHDKWLEEKGVKKTNFVVVTWSNWDCRVMLESECQLKKIRKPQYFNRWINLKVPFHEVFGGTRCNLKEAVQVAGLSWEGRAHCGLDDAKNTARLLTNLMLRGIHLTITNSLTWHQPQPQPSDQDPPPEGAPPHSVQWKPKAASSPNQPAQVGHGKEQHLQLHHQHGFCYCGEKSTKLMVNKPGEANHGHFYYICGNWTARGGALCHYFEWATTTATATL